MELDEFKKRLSKIDVQTSRWKEKMMLVVKLYKSLGYTQKDVLENPNILVDAVYSRIGTILNEIIYPTTEKFYMHILLQRETSNINAVKAKLTPEYISKLIMGEKEQNRDDINGDELFIESKHGKYARNVARKLIGRQEFVAKMYNFLKNKYNITSKEAFLEKLTKDKYGASACFCEYIKEDPIAKKAFDTLFIQELQEDEKARGLEIRNGLLTRILVINKFFSKCGYLEEIMQTNNAVMSRFNIPMNVSLEDNSKTDFNLMNLTNPDYYQQFSTEELFVLSAYYSNRLEKIVENMEDGIYLHAKLGTLYDSLETGEIPRYVEMSDVRTVLKQKRFMEELTKEEFKNYKNAKAGSEDVSDIEYVPEKYIAEYQKVYREYFDRYIRREENDFTADYKFAFMNRGISYCMYNIKDFSIESLLYTLSQNKSKINFGLIEEKRSIKNEYGERQVLIGVDYKEFPTIRLHFPKKDYDIFVKTFFKDEDFPLYVGNEDFSINGTEIKTPILYKFTKKQKQAIKKEMEEEMKNHPESDRYKFLRHMYENIHPNKNKINNKKKKKELDEI